MNRLDAVPVGERYANWNGIRKGGWAKAEEDPVDPEERTMAGKGAEALRHVEDVVLRADGAILRYGGSDGPGATDDHVELVRKRQFPLVGGGTGSSSRMHLDDAASATVPAVEQKARGVFNIVDGEPSPAGDVVVTMMTEGRGCSDAKAERELGWELRYPSWRQGFKAEPA
jgi:nucleoside-diphosphate-sugar epimerase